MPEPTTAPTPAPSNSLLGGDPTPTTPAATTPPEVTAATTVTTTPPAATTPPTSAFSMEQLIGEMDESLRDNPMFAKFKNVGEFGKSMIELNQLVGKKSDVPGDSATPEDWDAFWTKAGKPEKASEYGIELPDGLKNIAGSQERVDAALERCHKAGLTKAQAKAFMSSQLEAEAGEAKNLLTQQEETYTAARDKLTTAWGEGFDAMSNEVKQLQVKLGVFDQFEATGLNTNPDVLIMLGKIAKDLRQSPTIDAALSSTPAGVSSEISEVNAQIAEFLKKRQPVPQHLSARLTQLFQK